MQTWLEQTWLELSRALEVRIARTSPGERRVFAAGVAERLMRQHEALPRQRQEPLTLRRRPLLDAVWAGALGNHAAFADITRGVGDVLLSDHWDDERRDRAATEGEPAADAVLYAATTCLYGCADFVSWTSGCAVEASRRHVEHLADQADPGEAGATADPDLAVAEELRRQLGDLDLIARSSSTVRHAYLGLSPGTTARLGRELRTQLSLVVPENDSLTERQYLAGAGPFSAISAMPSGTARG